MAHKRKHILTLIYTIFTGTGWGLGLARTLGMDAQIPFFFQVTGVTLLAITGGCLSAVYYRWQGKRGIEATTIAAHTTPLLLPLLDVISGTFQPWRGPVLLTGSLGLMALLVLQPKLSYKPGLILAVAIPLLLYLPDISPYVGRADTFEFQVVAPKLGIAHPSGYPLYIMIGKLFSLLPLGSMAWRVNLSSACFTATAAGLLYLTLVEYQKGFTEQEKLGATHLGKCNAPVIIPLISALTLAFSPTLWSRSIEAEVYALNTFIVTMGLWLATRWVTRKQQTSKLFPFFGLLTGIGMASHLTLGALAFMALPLLATGRPRPKVRTLLSAAGLGLLGLSLYLYIPLRWPAVNHGEIMTLEHFVRFVTNAESGGALRPMAFIHDLSRWTLVLRLFVMQIGWPGLGLGALGLGSLFFQQQKETAPPQYALAIGSFIAFAAWVWFNLSFYVADPDYSAFLISGHVILIFWMGLGASALENKLEALPVNWLLPLALTALALLPLNRLWLTGPTLDTKALGKADEAWARYALSQPLTENAAILADSEKFPPLYYLQQVEGLRPDIELVMLFNEAQYQEALQTRVNAGQTVYLARYLPGMDVYGVNSAGSLVAITPRSDDVTTSPQKTEAQFGTALALINHSLDADNWGRTMHHLNLQWYVQTPITEDLGIRLRLVTPAGDIAWQAEETRPVAGYTITQAWQPGQVINDYHPLAWPDWLTPGTYTLEVGVFPRFAEKGLTVTSGTGSWSALEEITLSGTPAEQRERRLGIQWNGNLWLESAHYAAESWAGSPFAIEAVWRYSGQSMQDVAPVACWVKNDEDVYDAALLRAQGLPYSLSEWEPGKSIAQRYILNAPDKEGVYHLELGWVNTDTTQLYQGQCQWLGPQQEYCKVGAVRIGPSNAGLANFAGKILLVDAKIAGETFAPGNNIPIHLDWRGMQDMEADYTVFIQILGPDGKLYGQVDSWPVQGARPTGGWETSEEISDPYQVALAADAPRGEYQVITGWYLLATMERLQVVDEAGNARGDFYVIGEFRVE